MPERMITCSMCGRSRKLQYVGIRDAIDERGREVTQMVCAWCQRAERGEAGDGWPPKVTRWRAINETQEEAA